MKLMYFGKNFWIELHGYEDFETFYEEIVLEECAFKFIDGTAEEIENFFLKMEESCGDLTTVIITDLIVTVILMKRIQFSFLMI